jgi:hypothetical protein
MGSFNFSGLIKGVQSYATKHGPEILTGIGIAGMFSAIVLAVKDTPKAVKLIEEAEEVKGEKLTPAETVKTAWKCYIPTAVTCACSAACLIGATNISVRRHAVLTTAYELSRNALDEYKDKVVEKIGEKKEREIRDEIAQDKVNSNPVSSNSVIVTGRGKTLCCDMLFGKYFESDYESLKHIENIINHALVAGDSYYSLNQYYIEVGLSPVKNGWDLGWNVSDGLVEVQISATLSDDGRTPCLAVGFNRPPEYGFNRFA